MKMKRKSKAEELVPWGKEIPLAELEAFQKKAIECLSAKDPLFRPEEMMVVVESVDKWNDGLLLMHKEIAIAFAEIAESRNRFMVGHARRSAELARATAEELALEGVYPELLTPSLVRSIVVAAPLHDIGKTVIPDAILNKAGKLTTEEFEIMKTHTTEGKKIIDRINTESGGAPFLSLAAEIALNHHERWDGTGYPRGLRGTKIPLSARIMAVADVYDALVSERPYKPAWPTEEAQAQIASESGTHFDPIVAAALLKVVSR